MMATQYGPCSACDHRIQPGERIISGPEGWEHAKCPPPRVQFVCQSCFVICPCDCDEPKPVER